SKLVTCWTKDGKLDGGTAQALRMADCTGIPVINLGRPDLQGITADKVIELGQELIAARTAVLRDRPSLDQSPSPA
ncbi:MAG: hypothetical protein ABJK83_09130, partial [Parasphingorhabdus sp.]